MCHILSFCVLQILTANIAFPTDINFMAFCFLLEKPILCVVVIFIASVLSTDFLQQLKDDPNQSSAAKEFLENLRSHKNDLEWVDHLSHQYKGIPEVMFPNLNFDNILSDVKEPKRKRGLSHILQRLKRRRLNRNYPNWRPKRQSKRVKLRVKDTDNGLTGVLKLEGYKQQRVGKREIDKSTTSTTTAATTTTTHSHTTYKNRMISSKADIDVLGLENNISVKDLIREDLYKFSGRTTSKPKVKIKKSAKQSKMAEKTGDFNYVDEEEEQDKIAPIITLNAKAGYNPIANEENGVANPVRKINSMSPIGSKSNVIEDIDSNDDEDDDEDDTTENNIDDTNDCSTVIVIYNNKKPPIFERHSPHKYKKIIRKKETHSSFKPTYTRFNPDAPRDMIHNRNYKPHPVENKIYLDRHNDYEDDPSTSVEAPDENHGSYPEKPFISPARVQTEEPAKILHFKFPPNQHPGNPNNFRNELTEEEQKKAQEEANKLMSVDQEFNERNEPNDNDDYNNRDTNYYDEEISNINYQDENYDDPQIFEPLKLNIGKFRKDVKLPKKRDSLLLRQNKYQNNEARSSNYGSFQSRKLQSYDIIDDASQKSLQNIDEKENLIKRVKNVIGLTSFRTRKLKFYDDMDEMEKRYVRDIDYENGQGNMITKDNIVKKVKDFFGFGRENDYNEDVADDYPSGIKDYLNPEFEENVENEVYRKPLNIFVRPKQEQFEHRPPTLDLLKSPKMNQNNYQHFKPIPKDRKFHIRKNILSHYPLTSKEVMKGLRRYDPVVHQKFERSHKSRKINRGKRKHKANRGKETALSNKKKSRSEISSSEIEDLDDSDYLADDYMEDSCRPVNKTAQSETSQLEIGLETTTSQAETTAQLEATTTSGVTTTTKSEINNKEKPNEPNLENSSEGPNAKMGGNTSHSKTRVDLKDEDTKECEEIAPKKHEFAAEENPVLKTESPAAAGAAESGEVEAKLTTTEETLIAEAEENCIDEQKKTTPSTNNKKAKEGMKEGEQESKTLKALGAPHRHNATETSPSAKGAATSSTVKTSHATSSHSSESTTASASNAISKIESAENTSEATSPKSTTSSEQAGNTLEASATNTSEANAIHKDSHKESNKESNKEANKESHKESDKAPNKPTVTTTTQGSIITFAGKHNTTTTCKPDTTTPKTELKCDSKRKKVIPYKTLVNRFLNEYGRNLKFFENDASNGSPRNSKVRARRSYNTPYNPYMNRRVDNFRYQALRKAHKFQRPRAKYTPHRKFRTQKLFERDLNDNQTEALPECSDTESSTKITDKLPKEFVHHGNAATVEKNEIIRGQLTSKIVGSLFDDVKKCSSMQNHIGSYLKNTHKYPHPIPNLDIFHNNEVREDISHLEDMLHGIMSSLNTIIEEEVKAKTCIHLDPESANLLKIITGASSKPTKLETANESFSCNEPSSEGKSSSGEGIPKQDTFLFNEDGDDKMRPEAAPSNEMPEDVFSKFKPSASESQHLLGTNQSKAEDASTGDKNKADGSLGKPKDDACKTDEEAAQPSVGKGADAKAVQPSVGKNAGAEKAVGANAGKGDGTQAMKEDTKSQKIISEIPNKKREIKQLMKQFNSLPPKEQEKFSNIYFYLHKQNILLDRVMHQLRKKIKRRTKRTYLDSAESDPFWNTVEKDNPDQLKSHEVWGQDSNAGKKEKNSDKFMKLVKRGLYFRSRGDERDRVNNLKSGAPHKNKVDEWMKANDKEDVTIDFQFHNAR